MGNFPREASLFDGRNAITAADNRGSTVGGRIGDGARNFERPSRKWRLFEHSKRSVPYDCSRFDDFVAKQVYRFGANVEAHPIGRRALDSRELRLRAFFGTSR